MKVSAVQSYVTNFRGIERKEDPKTSNFAINGAGSGIGKNMLRQYLLAKLAPKGVWNKWDELGEIYKTQNLVTLNLGSMGLKGDQKIQDLPDEVILEQIKHGNILGDLPDSIRLSIGRSGKKTELQDTREIFLIAESKRNYEVIKLEATRQPVDWSQYKAQIVVDTTGANTTREKLMKHLGGTVKYAVLSAPSKNSDMLTVVPGINNEMLNEIEEKGNIVSAASCTTTCISPYIKLFEDKFGIESGFIDTTHAATGSQNIADKANSKAESKSRGSLDAMIPTTTGAAKAIGLVIKSKEGGKIPLDGLATRVPTGDGSMAIITLKLKEKTTMDEVVKVLKEAEKDPNYKNLIAKAPKGSTSKDVINRIESGLYIPEAIKLTNGDLLSIKVYYDNEFGYTRSLATLTGKVGERIIAENEANSPKQKSMHERHTGYGDSLDETNPTFEDYMRSRSGEDL